MKTEMIKIDRDDMDLREMKRAGEILKKGGLVAFPTETVYGLGGDEMCIRDRIRETLDQMFEEGEL